MQNFMARTDLKLIEKEKEVLRKTSIPIKKNDYSYLNLPKMCMPKITKKKTCE